MVRVVRHTQGRVARVIGDQEVLVTMVPGVPRTVVREVRGMTVPADLHSMALEGRLIPGPAVHATRAPVVHAIRAQVGPAEIAHRSANETVVE